MQQPINQTTRSQQSERTCCLRWRHRDVIDGCQGNTHTPGGSAEDQSFDVRARWSCLLYENNDGVGLGRAM